jgi:hypothetical protein
VIARLLEQTSQRPLDLFPLRGGSAHVFARAAQIDRAIWGAAFGDSHKDFEYHQLLEQTMRDGFTYRYLVVLDEHRDPVALQPLIIVDQDLAATARSTIAFAVACVRKLWPRFLRTRILLAGCLVGDSAPGIIAPANPRRVNALLAEALRKFARRQRISLMSIKDFPAELRAELLPFLDAGYARLDGFPPMRLPLDFDSFDSYMETRLSRATRKNLRRKLRRTDNVLQLEVLRDCSAVIDEIYPLYLEVAHRAPIEFEIFSREYFLEAGRCSQDRHRYFVWRYQGRVVAFSFCTIWNNTIFDNDIGFDYGVAHELSLYHRTFRDIIVWALAHGLTEYRSAPFNYEPKLHLRLEPVDVDLYVRHRSPLVNAILKIVAPYFAPARSDLALRKYLRRRNSA